MGQAQLVNLGNGQVGLETAKGKQFNITFLDPLNPDHPWTDQTIQLVGIMADFIALENYTLKMNGTNQNLTITRNP